MTAIRTAWYADLCRSVENLDDASEIAVMGDAACALRADGSVWCWGDGTDGTLGNGEALLDGDVVQESSAVPVPAQVTRATHLGGAGGGPQCAVLGDGHVTCWGPAVGSEATSSTPALVDGLTNATAVAVAGAHACALLADGTVACWGSNYDGGLGNGEIEAKNYTPPVQVVGLRGVTELAAGGWHTCALVEDGSVWCWGQNSFGELGDGTTTNRALPTRVIGLPCTKDGGSCP